MGNKQSSGQDTSGVKKRQKTGKKSKRERPVSYPPGGQLEAAHHGLRRTGSETIGGQINYSPNPVQEDHTPDHPRYLAGASALGNDATINTYNKALQQVLGVWPEYEPLLDIDVTSVHLKTLDTVQQVYKRMCEQQHLIVSLSKEAHDMKLYLHELKVRNETQEDTILMKGQEMEDLVWDIGFLKGELRRRGIDPRLPDKRSSQEGMPEHGLNRQLSGGSSVDMRGAADGLEISTSRSGISRYRGSGFVATPIVQAEGINAGTAIKRSQSLKSGQAGPAVGVQNVGARSTSEMVENLNMRVRTLQLALDAERTEKAQLQDRLECLDFQQPEPTLSRVSGPTLEQLSALYSRVEAQALSKVMVALSKHCSQVSDARRYMFLCGVMETAYLRAADLMEQFRHAVTTLLQRPLDPAVSTKHSRNGPRSAGPTLSPVRRFDFQDHSSAVTGGSRKALPMEMPYRLEEEIGNYIRDTADYVDIEVLIEGVTDYMRYDFAEVATPSCLNNASVAQFLHDCCRLAWRLAIMSPPCHASVGDSNDRFDERHHRILPVQERSGPSLSKSIDYFVWPILYDRKHGDVIYKGRVALKRLQK